MYESDTEVDKVLDMYMVKQGCQISFTSQASHNPLWSNVGWTHQMPPSVSV